MEESDRTKPIKYPAIWDEQWLEIAINEYNTRPMSSEERFHYARIISINAQVVRAEKQKTEEAVNESIKQYKVETIQRALKYTQLTDEDIARLVSIDVAFVREVKQLSGRGSEKCGDRTDTATSPLTPPAQCV